MSISEITQIVQTVVLVFSVCVVFWYTWETRRIRISSERQLQAMAGQLRILEEQARRQWTREQSQVPPVFVLSRIMPGLSGPAVWTLENIGGRARLLTVTPTGPWKVESEDREIVERGDKVVVVAHYDRTARNPECAFAINCVDDLNGSHEFRFRPADGGRLVRDAENQHPSDFS